MNKTLTKKSNRLPKVLAFVFVVLSFLAVSCTKNDECDYRYTEPTSFGVVVWVWGCDGKGSMVGAMFDGREQLSSFRKGIICPNCRGTGKPRYN
jgi:hypothetical protein